MEASDQFAFVDPLHQQSPPEEIKKSYHLRLATDAGLLVTDGRFMPKGRGTLRMTSAGHDYLDAIRNEGIWADTKKAVKEGGGSATLEIVKLIAIGFIRKQLKERAEIEI